MEGCSVEKTGSLPSGFNEGGEMWIVKGILAGLGIFLVGSVFFIRTLIRFVSKMQPIEDHKATGINVILSVLVSDIWLWATFIATIALACWFFKTRAA
jgi:hypothetical protein